MSHRSPARYLAPLALVALVVAVIVMASGGSGGGSSKAATPATARHLHHFATVRDGDSLSGISARTGVSVQQIEQLNARLDPNTLRPGQRLKIRQ